MGIIPLRERNEFINRDRIDYRAWKDLDDDHLESAYRALPVQPPIYYKLSRTQRICFLIGAQTKKFCFFLDTGCLDGKTLLETDRGAVRIDELCRLGKAINVLSRTESGLKYVPASAPFKKGPTALFEVLFDSGKRMVVTAKHRFLTERGYVACEQLKIGERLPEFDVSHHQSNLGFSLQESPANACHLSRKLQDLKDDCCQYHHLYDEQPHLELDSAPNQIPLFGEIREQNHSFLHKDDLGIELPSSRHDLSELKLAGLSLFSSTHNEFRVLEYDSAQFVQKPCNVLQGKAIDSLRKLRIQDRVDFSFDSLRQDDRFCNSPLAFSNSSDCIKDIKYLKTDYYYDLHVPIYENYIAEGFCHHNTGKTLLIIALVRYFRRLGILHRALILVPGRPNKDEWRDELVKHSPKSSYLLLPSSVEEKWKAIEEGKELFVIETYAGFYHMLTTKTQDKKGKNYLALDPKKVKRAQSHFQGFACDESENVGQHQGLPFRSCRQLAKTAEVAFTMTGTPFNRDPTLLWAQMFLVDGGYTLGETLGLFRSVFCGESLNYWSGHPEYKFLKKKQPLLNDFIANRSIEYEADKASLPACVPVNKFVSLGEDATQYYNRFKDQLMAAQGNLVETKNAFIRMRQISSGFIGFEDDETGEKAKFEFPENPKLEMLLSILHSTRSEYKVVVFFEYTYSGERILAELKKHKIGASILYGKTKDTEAAKKKFLNDPKTRVLLLQNRMAAGLNVQVAKYSCFYESPVSAIKRKQCARRVVRQHSAHKTVFQYDLLMRNTVDEQILEFHKQGGDLFEAIIRGQTVAK